MAPFCPHYTAALRKTSCLNVVTDGIHKNDYGYLHQRMLSPYSVDATTMRWSAPSSHAASNTDARAPATEMGEDIVERPTVFFELDVHGADERSTTADDGATDDKTFWTKALPQLLNDNAPPPQPSEGDQIARLGSLEILKTSWDPWESELLQDDFWGLHVFEDDTAGI
ncbi:hypothetical protein T484DRAFT_1744975 [Baffinella frigidus]|nr:hypothetical protein T484DRAFT_1744975 [Cryptophyta sp. CCMP2293]